MTDVFTVMRKWKVTKWLNKPSPTSLIALACPNCGRDSRFELSSSLTPRVIGAIGLGLILDPPGLMPLENDMPNSVQCPHCRKEFGE